MFLPHLEVCQVVNRFDSFGKRNDRIDFKLIGPIICTFVTAERQLSCTITGLSILLTGSQVFMQLLLHITCH